MRTKIPPVNPAFTKNLRNKNQLLIFVNIKGCDYIYFQSYESECAIVNVDTGDVYWNLKCRQSKTTMKHLYIFLSEYCNLTTHNRNELEALVKGGEIKTYSR